jgi:diguanylate cyclase (GGDEF)-like protein
LTRNAARKVGSELEMQLPEKDGPVTSLFDLAVEVLQPRRASLMLRSQRAPDELIISQATGIDEDIVKASRVRIGMPIAGRVAAEKQPLLISDINSQSDLVLPHRGDYSTPSFVSVPLLAEDQVLGVMNMADKLDGVPFSHADLFLLMRFAHRLSNFLRYEGELREAHEQANTDPLTGLLNRRVLLERLSKEIDLAKISGKPGCLLIVELNNLKEINEFAGRLAGDAVVVMAAQLITEQVLCYDALFRSDGAQFIVLLPRTHPIQAHKIAVRIQHAITNARPPHPALGQVALSTRVGEAYFPATITRPFEVIERADNSLTQTPRPSQLLMRLKKYQNLHENDGASLPASSKKRSLLAL